MIADEYFRNAVVVRVKDGDTIVANVDLGFSVWTKKTFRLYGIQAPEKNTKEGKRSAKYLKRILSVGTEVVLEVIRNPGGKFSKTFDRYVAIPYKNGRNVGDMNEVNICDLLVEKGYAKMWTKFKRFRKKS